MSALLYGMCWIVVHAWTVLLIAGAAWLGYKLASIITRGVQS